MRILIVGAGIAGLATAYWLKRLGHSPIVLERAPRLRAEGYMITFSGVGITVAERMGLAGRLREADRLREGESVRLSYLRPDGSPKFTLDQSILRDIVGDAQITLMRGDLERTLHEAVQRDVHIRFGATVDMLEERGERMRAHLTDGGVVEADMVIGADGLHSHIRAITFGPEERFIRFLKYRTASFVLPQFDAEGFSGDTSYSLTEPARQAAVYPLDEDRVAAFFIHAAKTPRPRGDRAFAIEELRRVYDGMGWVVPRLLERLDEVSDIYFDDVSQVELPAWHRRRVVLVGDACHAVSLIAGQGAVMAMAGAYVLAEEMTRSDGDLQRAFARYEARLKPAIGRIQKQARRSARLFVPGNRLVLEMRDAMLRLTARPAVARAFRRQVVPGESVAL